jgi:cellobiose transport system permease protein
MGGLRGLMVLAGVHLTTIPLSLLFVLAGRHLVRGIIAGAVKG